MPDPFTDAFRNFSSAPGFYLNEYHRACLNLPPNLYAFLLSDPGINVPQVVADELDTVRGGSQLWDQLTRIG
ncbi:MAG: hypothetical protein R3C56_40120 [Pirellulaceae bacterium]